MLSPAEDRARTTVEEDEDEDDDDVSFMDAKTRVTRSADALGAALDDEVVVLQMGTGSFHQLNPIATYLWNRLEEPRTITELCDHAGSTFEADQDELRRDIEAFVDQLHAAGLIELA